MIYLFDGYSLDSERRELRRGEDIVAVEPQVFDVLHHLIRNRDRVVSKEDLLAEVWGRRIVSESTLSSRLTAVRHAVGDSGERQRLIRTLPRKGFRFVASVREQAAAHDRADAAESSTLRPVTADGPADSPGARHGGAAERRPLTILSCRVVDAAATARHVDPEDLREVVALYRHCIREVVERYAGCVARYTDDGMVGYFGYPQAQEDDAERSVRAGLTLVRSIGALRVARSSWTPQASVGIATGLVLIGDSIDPDRSAERCVIGEPHLLAARMLELARPGEVVIAEGTRRLVGKLFDFGDSAQTKGAPPEASPVLRESAIASRFEALRPRPRRLVGREEELQLLSRRWAQAKSGQGRAVLIWGEPGIGKSHLVAAFVETLAREPHTAMQYFCSPGRTQTALYPVITEIERAADFDAGDGDQARLDKLGQLLALRSPRAHEDSAAGKDVSLFAALLSIATTGRYEALALSTQRRKELVFEGILGQLAGIAARGPALIVLEDAHWIDPTSRELFDIVIERVRELRAMLIMTYRPEFNPAWLGQSHVTAMTLNRLDRSGSATLVTQVAGGKALPPRLLDQVMARTDGVPLFIEELTQSILESGILREERENYVLEGPIPAIAVPSTLQASLAARLDRFTSAREVAQIGAAVGREFSYAVAKAVMALPDAELSRSLGQIVMSGLVHQRGDVPHSLYSFKHALVQDAAYESIPRSERPRIHRRIAEVIEQQFSDAGQRQPDVLAHHFTAAGLAEKAIQYSIVAARIALSRSAGVEARTHVERAMELVQATSPKAVRRQLEGRLHHAFGDALVMTEGFASPQVLAAMSKAREMLDGNANALEALGALCGQFNYHLIRSESPAALALVESHRRGAADRPTKAVIHYLSGAAHLHLGNFLQSIEHLEQALALYEEKACGPVSFIAGYHLRSFILIWLGLGYLYTGSMKRAAETIVAAVSDARSRSHPFTLVSALLALARFRSHTRDLDGAIAATEEGMAIAAEQRSPYHVSRAGVLRGVNAIDQGRPEAGIAIMENALAAHRATGANFQSAYNLSCLALAHARLKDRAAANRLAAEAIAEVDRTGERWWEAEALRIRGEILMGTGEKSRVESEACFRRALKCARGQQARLWELNASLSLAKLWVAQGEGAQARRLLEPIARAFGDDHQMEALRSARRLLDELAPSSGHLRRRSDSR